MERYCDLNDTIKQSQHKGICTFWGVQVYFFASTLVFLALKQTCLRRSGRRELFPFHLLQIDMCLKINTIKEGSYPTISFT